MTHPARGYPFKELADGLRDAEARGVVKARRTAEAPELGLFTYTRSCVYDDGWDEFSLMARGLVLDFKRQCVVATPFPKFFNVGERGEWIPEGAFDTYEKLDGSLIIIYYHDGSWRTITKGSFSSEQAKWAADRLCEGRSTVMLNKGTTYLAEAIYPENRIVVRYDKPQLVLLAAYDEDGSEIPLSELAELADKESDPFDRLAGLHHFEGIKDLLEHAETLSGDEEGYVIRFTDGYRLKVKGAEYRRLHALIHNVTPLAMWGYMRDGRDMNELRRDLPEEFWDDFDQIYAILSRDLTFLNVEMAKILIDIQDKTDKEVGLSLNDFPPEYRRIIFPMRKFSTSSPKVNQLIYNHIRPTANILNGYQPSYALNRVHEEGL